MLACSADTPARPGPAIPCCPASPPLIGRRTAPTPAGWCGPRAPRRIRPVAWRRTAGSSPAVNSGPCRRPGLGPRTCQPGWRAAQRPTAMPAGRRCRRVRPSRGRSRHAEPTGGKQTPFIVAEQLIAPGDQRLQRLVSRRAGGPAGKQPGVAVQACSELFGAQAGAPGRREFDGERHAVEPPAEIGDRGRIGRGNLECGIHRARLGGEESAGLGPSDRAGRAIFRQAKRRHRSASARARLAVGFVASRSGISRASAMHAGTRSGSVRGGSSARCARSPNAASASIATRRATRVLPQPPGPVSVTSGAV